MPRVAHVTPPPAIGQEGEGRGRLGASLPELPLQQPAEHRWATRQRLAARSAAWVPRTRQKERGVSEAAAGVPGHPHVI